MTSFDKQKSCSGMLLWLFCPKVTTGWNDTRPLLKIRCITIHYGTPLSVLNGTQVAQDITEQINSHFHILTSSLQRNTHKTQQLYEACFKTGCCSEDHARGTAVNMSYYHATSDDSQLPVPSFNRLIGERKPLAHCRCPSSCDGL